MWDVFVIRRNNKFLAGLANENFGNNELIVIRQISAAWTRLQQRNAFYSLLHLIDRLAEPARNLWQTALAQGFHKIPDDLVLDGVLAAIAFQLQHQAFAEISRSNSWRMKRLNHLQDVLDPVRVNIGREAHLLDAGFEVAILVDIANDHFGNRPLFFVKI